MSRIWVFIGLMIEGRTFCCAKIAKKSEPAACGDRKYMFSKVRGHRKVRESTFSACAFGTLRQIDYLCNVKSK